MLIRLSPGIKNKKEENILHAEIFLVPTCTFELHHAAQDYREGAPRPPPTGGEPVGLSYWSGGALTSWEECEQPYN